MAASHPKQNPELAHALVELRRAARDHSAPVWAAVARRLERGRHQVPPVRVGQLERASGGREVVVVPGTLLADGEIARPITVAAFRCSATARAKVHAAGGRVLTLHELLQWRPDGSGVTIVA
ncbi:MAG: 50S ribosomal protein L18e [Thermoplasmata archaeon]